MDLTQATQAIALAEQHPHGSAERFLLAVSAVQAALPARSVLVGGGAVWLYDDTYGATDIDLVTPATREEALASLSELGFAAEGSRHLAFEFTDGSTVTVELVSGPLGPEGVATEMFVELIDGHGIWTIDPLGLLVDRLLQHQAGDIPDTEIANLWNSLSGGVAVTDVLAACERLEAADPLVRGLTEATEQLVGRP